VTSDRAFSDADRRWMRRSLTLARRALGRSWPNPPVGCALAKGGRLVGAGHTAPGGRPHAEAVALAEAGDAARASTAYVTLEPCAHHGSTPPCADALLRAGVARCVIALEDPDPRVAGGGAARLQENGVQVEFGLLAEEAAEFLRGHRNRLLQGRPWVNLKLAATLDGSVGGSDRSRRQITGERARAWTEGQRTEHDGVLTGIGTVLADDPLLLPCNPALAARPPVRIVIDARLQTPPSSRLVRSAGSAPLWLVHGPSAAPERQAALRTGGARLLQAPIDSRGAVQLRPALERLAAAGLTSLLVEAGPRLAASLLGDALIDQVVWLSAGRLHGPGGLPAVDSSASDLRLIETFQLGGDIGTVWRPSAGA